MARIQFKHEYHHIISLENLLEAWKEFVRGKRSRKDVQEFERNLMANIISLHHDLAAKTYKHSLYQAFIDIVSENDTQTVWVLKCDIKKFFANIDHTTLLEIVASYIPDKDIVWLISLIVKSFHSTTPDVGLPLGNLTSQLLVNIYMNDFDQFMKHAIKAQHYVRYADDFAVLSQDREYLEAILPCMQDFLQQRLRLTMHPDKVFIKTIASGVDFLGWVHFPDHRVLRTSTKRRMISNMIRSEKNKAATTSYKGLLAYGNSWKLIQKIDS